MQYMVESSLLSKGVSIRISCHRRSDPEASSAESSATIQGSLCSVALLQMSCPLIRDGGVRVVSRPVLWLIFADR